MSFSMWLRIPRIRRGLAITSVILSAGGLVLLRAPASAKTGTVSLFDTSKNAVEFAGPGLKGSLALSHGKVLAGSSFELYGDLRLTADAGDRAKVRAPISLAVVLDTSGSMSGEKIDEAKRSVVKLLRDMRDDDEIALVRYSDGSETIQPLARLGNVRESLIRRVEALEAGGGTNIPSGLRRGRDTLAEAGLGRVRRVVLVSDGLDSSRRESERLAADASEAGVTTSSLGIGLDFDETYMGGVANQGHGNFAYVRDGAALAGFLQKELVETSTTVVENTTVRVKIPSGVRFVRATGAEAKVVGSDVVLKAGSLFAGDERRVLLEFSTDLASGDARVLDGNASWDRVGGGHADVRIENLGFAAVSDQAAVDGSRDAAVFARAMSVVASRRQIEATEAFSRGDNARGQALIQQNQVSLGQAAAAAPAAMRPKLEAQVNTYESDSKAFATGGSGARDATKKAMARELGNTGRAATY